MKEYNKKDLFRYEGMKCHTFKTPIALFVGYTRVSI